MIKLELPASVYRCKGVVYTAEQPDRRAVLRVVGRRATVTFDERWEARPPRTQIVAIGEPGALSPSELDDMFAGCLAGSLAHSEEHERTEASRRLNALRDLTAISFKSEPSEPAPFSD